MRRRISRIGRVPQADLYPIEADAFGQFDGRRFGFQLEVPVRRADFKFGVTRLQSRCQRSGRECSPAGPDELAPIQGKRRVAFGPAQRPCPQSLRGIGAITATWLTCSSAVNGQWRVSGAHDTNGRLAIVLVKLDLSVPQAVLRPFAQFRSADSLAWLPVPKGQTAIAQRFIAGFGRAGDMSPGGTKEGSFLQSAR